MRRFLIVYVVVEGDENGAVDAAVRQFYAPDLRAG
jgi:hypothetical protein